MYLAFFSVLLIAIAGTLFEVYGRTNPTLTPPAVLGEQMLIWHDHAVKAADGNTGWGAVAAPPYAISLADIQSSATPIPTSYRMTDSGLSLPWASVIFCNGGTVAPCATQRTVITYIAPPTGTTVPNAGGYTLGQIAAQLGRLSLNGSGIGTVSSGAVSVLVYDSQTGTGSTVTYVMPTTVPAGSVAIVSTVRGS